VRLRNNTALERVAPPQADREARARFQQLMDRFLPDCVCGGKNSTTPLSHNSQENPK
jgi:hypothetical protein